MKTKIKEYYTLLVEDTGEGTEDTLNELAKKGWRLICSYSGGRWLIMERDLEVEACKECGKLKKL